MLSLSTAKSGALIGVLISVTTIPAAANVGVATAYADWSEVGGATAQRRRRVYTGMAWRCVQTDSRSKGRGQ